MYGAGRYQGFELLGKYWCTTCNEVHCQKPASEEYILKTGWHMVGDEYYNIGFCNGVHATQDAPKHLAKRNAHLV